VISSWINLATTSNTAPVVFRCSNPCIWHCFAKPRNKQYNRSLTLSVWQCQSVYHIPAAASSINLTFTCDNFSKQLSVSVHNSPIGPYNRDCVLCEVGFCNFYYKLDQQIAHILIFFNSSMLRASLVHHQEAKLHKTIIKVILSSPLTFRSLMSTIVDVPHR